MKVFLSLCLMCLVPSFAFAEPPAQATQVLEEESWVETGMKAVQANHLQEALADFRQAKKINPNFAPAYVGEAQVLTVQNAWDEAMALLNRAITLSPEFAIAYHNRGILHYYRKEYLEAHADLRKAINLGETVDKDLLFQVWGAAFPGDAAQLMTEQIAKNPLDGESYLNRGIAYFYQNNYQAALNDWKKAKELGVHPDAGMWQELEKQIKTDKGSKHAAV